MILAPMRKNARRDRAGKLGAQQGAGLGPGIGAQERPGGEAILRIFQDRSALGVPAEAPTKALTDTF